MNQGYNVWKQNKTSLLEVKLLSFSWVIHHDIHSYPAPVECYDIATAGKTVENSTSTLYMLSGCLNFNCDVLAVRNTAFLGFKRKHHFLDFQCISIHCSQFYLL